MRTIFKFNQDKRIITAYELGDAKSAEHVVSEFLDDYYGCTGFKDAGEYVSLYDEGYKRLVWGEDGNLLLQRRTGKEYLGLFAQSNFGVAGHGCDHYYEDEYRYTYLRSLLPKDIMAAFQCMYSTIYYSSFIDKVINSNQGEYGRYSVIDEEKAILLSAKKNLEVAAAKVSFEEFNVKNNEMVWAILDTIFVKEAQEYPITCVEDLVELFERYHHPIQYCMSLYGHYNHKFANLDEFFNSLYTKGEDYSDEKYKRCIREVFGSFELTPDWLEFVDLAKEEKYKKLRMRKY